MKFLTQYVNRSLLSVAVAGALLTGGGTVASIALGTVPAALADDAPSGPPAGGPHGHRMGQMLMSLNLSDDQKQRISAIMADARKQNADVTDRDQRRANMKAAIAKVDTVLTPAQRTEWHAKMEAARQQTQGSHPQ
jgi:Spy/CpxP family protein refolding chaperone